LPGIHNNMAFRSGGTAVITGGANGIGFASAQRFAAMGLNVVIADRDESQLAEALNQLRNLAVKGSRAESFLCDVSDAWQVRNLAAFARDAFGAVSVLMNNAGAGINPGKPWENLDGWKKLIEINLWGVIHGVQAFLPAMLAGGEAGMVINTSSKQGITRPPGNSAYNLSKAGVLAFTESLAHELRQIANCKITAHLLIPGFTYTGMTARRVPEKPAAAWMPGQVVEFMLESIERGDFYILCPDNDVSRDMDERRIQWTADDIIRNRPALSRWHPDYASAFAAFMKQQP
jgi:NAD(P)-dependent dehydrogenase (short-subunit alcohol dehydrogenase family)